MLADYHTHSYRCGHATGETRDYIEKGIAAGLDEIGLTDHLWLYFEELRARNTTYAIAEGDYSRHYEEMLALRDEYRGSIEVRVAVEADYVEGFEDQLLEILGGFEFDYVLGSVHFMDGWYIDAPEYAERYRESSVDAIYRRYYANLQKAIGLGCFDLLAHFDLPKKFGFRPEDDLASLVRETLDVAAAGDIAIELSSAGLRKPIGEIYPERWIVQEMRRRDIPIALSSDAHAPAEAGAGFGELLRLARSEGYDHVVSFERRQRRLMTLG